MCYCKLIVQMVEGAYSARSYDKGHDAMNNLKEDQKVVFVQIYEMSIIRTHVDGWGRFRVFGLCLDSPRGHSSVGNNS